MDRGHWPENDLRRAFVDGAAWWEWQSQGATMWQSDRRDAEQEASNRYKDKALLDWQPIETAPKDGTEILITGGGPEYGWDSCCWDVDWYPSMVVALWDRGLQLWRFACYDAGVYGCWLNPTHWMPLPEPPETEGKG